MHSLDEAMLTLLTPLTLLTLITMLTLVPLVTILTSWHITTLSCDTVEIIWCNSRDVLSMTQCQISVQFESGNEWFFKVHEKRLWMTKQEPNILIRCLMRQYYKKLLHHFKWSNHMILLCMLGLKRKTISNSPSISIQKQLRAVLSQVPEKTFLQCICDKYHLSMTLGVGIMDQKLLNMQKHTNLENRRFFLYNLGSRP